MRFLPQKQLKTNFFHPMWYDLAVVDGLSTNSTITVDLLGNHFFRQTTQRHMLIEHYSWFTVQLMPKPSHSIQNVTCSQIHFCYAAYSAIYWNILELFFIMPNHFPYPPVYSIQIWNPSVKRFFFVAFWKWYFN